MAAADFHICDQCQERKTFYDADLAFNEDGLPDGAGAMLVLCEECSRSHRLEIVPIQRPGFPKDVKV